MKRWSDRPSTSSQRISPANSFTNFAATCGRRAEKRADGFFGTKNTKATKGTKENTKIFLCSFLVFLVLLVLLVTKPVWPCSV